MMKEKNRPHLVFIRHAHRDKPIPDADNGLSQKGREQVEDLVKDYKKEHLPPSQVFWSSPKKRCIETLKPITEQAKARLHIEKLLDEQQGAEGSQKFQERIEALIEKAQTEETTVYLCSHGDLIPEALDMLTGKFIDISKGEAIQVQFKNGEWKLL